MPNNDLYLLLRAVRPHHVRVAARLPLQMPFVGGTLAHRHVNGLRGGPAVEHARGGELRNALGKNDARKRRATRKRSAPDYRQQTAVRECHRSERRAVFKHARPERHNAFRHDDRLQSAVLKQTRIEYGYAVADKLDGNERRAVLERVRTERRHFFGYYYARESAPRERGIPDGRERGVLCELDGRERRAVLECIRADRAYLFGYHYAGKSAADERTVVYRSECGRQRDGFKAFAPAESRSSDRCDTVWKRYGSKAAATVEDIRSERIDRRSRIQRRRLKLDGSQVCAILESVCAHRRRCRRQRYRTELIAFERFGTDRRDAFGYSQTCKSRILERRIVYRSKRLRQRDSKKIATADKRRRVYRQQLRRQSNRRKLLAVFEHFGCELIRARGTLCRSYRRAHERDAMQFFATAEHRSEHIIDGSRYYDIDKRRTRKSLAIYSAQFFGERNLRDRAIFKHARPDRSKLGRKGHARKSAVLKRTDAYSLDVVTEVYRSKIRTILERIRPDRYKTLTRFDGQRYRAQCDATVEHIVL